MIDNDILDNVKKAIAAGAPPDEAIKRGYAKQAERDSGIQNNTTTDTKAGGWGKTILDILGGIADPFVQTGRRVAGAAIQTPAMLGKGALAPVATDINAPPIQQQAAKTGIDFLDKIINATQTPIAGGPSVGLSNQELQNIGGQNPITGPEQLKQLGRGAEMISWGIPVGKSTSILGKTIPALGAGKGGALIGAMQSLGNENVTPESIVENAVVGGIGGKVFEKLLGAGDTLANAGKGLRGTIVNPQVKATPYMDEAEQKIVEDTLSLLKGGSAQAQVQQMAEKYSSLTGDLKKIISESNVKRSGVKLRGMIDDALQADGFVGPEYDKIRTALINSKIPVGRQGLDVLTNAKKRIGDQFKSVFTKMANGTGNISPREEVGYAVWKELDNLIAKLEPATKQTTLQMSALWKAAPGLDRAREAIKLQIPLTNVGLNFSRPVQAVVDKTGKAVGGTGNVLQSVLNIIPKDQRAGFAAKSINPLLGLLGGGEVGGANLTNAPRVKQNELTPADIESIGKGTATQPENAEPDLAISTKQMQQILMHPDISAKTKANYLQAYKLQPGAGLTAIEKGQVLQAKQGEKLVSVLEKYWNNLNQQGLTASGAGLGRLQGVRGNIAAIAQTSPTAASFEDTKQAFLSKMARAGGEKGVLTDKDLQRIEKAIPSVYDTADTAALKFATIKQIISDAIQTKMDTRDFTSLDKALTGE